MLGSKLKCCSLWYSLSCDSRFILASRSDYVVLSGTNVRDSFVSNRNALYLDDRCGDVPTLLCKKTNTNHAEKCKKIR